MMLSKALVPEPDGVLTGSPPVCTVLAGANGSGKSSIFELLRPVGEFVNADVIARSARLGDAQAARRTILRLNALLRERKDFVFETTLSGRHAISVMRAARDAGYEVGLVFVALINERLHIRRVAERVSRGGHHIPDDVIRRRFPKTFRNLAEAVALARGCLIYDNSEQIPRLLLRIDGGIVVQNALDLASAHHVALAEAVAAALDLAVGQVLEVAGNGHSRSP